MPHNDASDPELISHSAAVVVAFTPEVHTYLMSLFPTPGAFAELHGKLESGYAAYLRGDPEGVKFFEENREAVKQFLTMLNGLAKVAAIKDPTVPQKLGLGQLHARNARSTIALAEPEGMRIFYDRKGNIYATVAKVPNAKGYEVWVCEGDPNIEANWRLAASATSSRGIHVPPLNRTTANWLRIRGMRGTEAGPWSNFVTLPPV